MAAREISFVVLGRPAPGGSKRAFPIRRGGVLTGSVAVTDDSKRAKPWQALVASAAVEKWNGPLLEGPLALTLVFVLKRPKSHYGSGRNSRSLRRSAPLFPAVKPDVSKLARSTVDALTGVLIRDDAQIAIQQEIKLYGEPERCKVDLWLLEGELP